MKIRKLRKLRQEMTGWPVTTGSRSIGAVWADEQRVVHKPSHVTVKFTATLWPRQAWRKHK